MNDFINESHKLIRNTEKDMNVSLEDNEEVMFSHIKQMREKSGAIVQKFFESDKVTPLVDNDADTIIDTKTVGGYGSEFNFYVQVFVTGKCVKFSNRFMCLPF